MDRPVGTWSAAVTAVFVPVALFVFSALLWSYSNEVVALGFLDRAAFGWLVVMPLLASIPLVGGATLSRADRRVQWPVAAFLGIATGIVVGGLFLGAVAMPACEYGTVRTALEWVPNAIGLGLASGAPLAAGLSSVAALWRHRRVAAVFAGLAASAAAFFLLALVLGVSLQPLCNRPF